MQLKLFVIHKLFSTKNIKAYTTAKTGKQLLTTFAVFNKDHNGTDI
jgi:hypothetical protein